MKNKGNFFKLQKYGSSLDVDFWSVSVCLNCSLYEEGTAEEKFCNKKIQFIKSVLVKKSLKFEETKKNIGYIFICNSFC